MLITNSDVINVLGDKLKRARKKLKYTQEYVAENIDISIDLLRSIENGRNIGSVPTLLNLCNFLKISPNTLFSDLLNFEEDSKNTLDTVLIKLFKQLSKNDKQILKDIIIHIDKNY
ncbi:MAG: helix-turn-helix transcriptional regulator [Clostridia bacterium]|nr:helix-turn-helix transcriptional regulator [Clostridia bacterium]